MKKGFTMIELIFVIVILGILAAVAIPRLAATRDDARAASIKTDVVTALSAVPAWYTGQRHSSFTNALSLDQSSWVTVGATEQVRFPSGAANLAGACIQMTISDQNDTAPALDPVATNLTAGTENFTSVLVVERGGLVNTECNIIWDEMDLQEQNITMGGSRVQW